MQENYLSHHGILGQKWGVRRYQNEDGSLTAAGRRRMLRQEYGDRKKTINDLHKLIDQAHTSLDKENRERFKGEKKTIKEQYKSGKITKKQMSSRIKEQRARADQRRNQNENNMVISHYKAVKQLRKYKAEYMRDVYGENSKRFKKAIRAASAAVEYYGNYSISVLPNGDYHIIRYDYA